MTLPEYSITISPASMFLLQNSPLPWMGDLETANESFKRHEQNSEAQDCQPCRKLHYTAPYNIMPTRTALDLSCPLFPSILLSDFIEGCAFLPSSAPGENVPVDTNCLLGGLLQVSEAHGHRQIHTGCPPRTERPFFESPCHRLCGIFPKIE